MSRPMLLFNEPTSLNGLPTPKSILSAPINTILEVLEDMNTLCSDIRSKRNLGYTTDALDTLQNTFQASSEKIIELVNRLHNNYDKSMEDPTDEGINTLHRCAKQLVDELSPRLRRIALRHNTGNQYGAQYGLLEHPHFGEITHRVQEIHRVIEETIRAVAERMKGNSSLSPTLKEILRNGKGAHTAELAKLLEDLENLAKDCWEERVSAGRLVFVNVYDKNVIRYDRPWDGFVKNRSPNSMVPLYTGMPLPLMQALAQQRESNLGRYLQTEQEHDRRRSGWNR